MIVRGRVYVMQNLHSFHIFYNDDRCQDFSGGIVSNDIEE